MTKPAQLHTEDGYSEYRYAGRPHRDDGPAAVFDGGMQQWYRHGYLHRDGGPAVTHANGDEEWYRRGKLHRIDGPAEIIQDWRGTGRSKYRWHIHGRLIETPSEFRKVLGLTKEQIMFIMIQWGWFEKT